MSLCRYFDISLSRYLNMLYDYYFSPALKLNAKGPFLLCADNNGVVSSRHPRGILAASSRHPRGILAASSRRLRGAAVAKM